MKYNKILIVPDVHGRDFWKKAYDLIDKVDKVVFLGDYMDPYGYEGITYEQAINNFREIIKFAKVNKDKVVLLLGNHDWVYIDTSVIKGSRYDFEHSNEISKEFEHENWDLFKQVYVFNKYIFSHAPIRQEWLDAHNLTLSKLENMDFPLSSLNDLSDFRGGYSDYGSCVWSDIRETSPLFGKGEYYQITGHTQLQEYPIIYKDVADLDVRRCFILNLETNKIEELKND